MLLAIKLVSLNPEVLGLTNSPIEGVMDALCVTYGVFLSRGHQWTFEHTLLIFLTKILGWTMNDPTSYSLLCNLLEVFLLFVIVKLTVAGETREVKACAKKDSQQSSL